MDKQKHLYLFRGNNPMCLYHQHRIKRQYIDINEVIESCLPMSKKESPEVCNPIPGS